MVFKNLLRERKDKKETVEEQMIHWFEQHGVCILEHIEENFEERFIKENEKAKTDRQNSSNESYGNFAVLN